MGNNFSEMLSHGCEYLKNYKTPVFPAHVSMVPFAYFDLAYKRRMSGETYFDVLTQASKVFPYKCKA